jgi:hypothetical protein
LYGGVSLILWHAAPVLFGIIIDQQIIANSTLNCVALTIMFQREEGYDTANNNWFWVEYNPDGSVLNYQDESLYNLTPADVCFGRGESILINRQRIKKSTLAKRHLHYQRLAA